MTDPRLRLPTSAEADALFSADPTGADDETTETFGMPTIPAGSPALRMLRSELESTRASLPLDSPQRRLLDDVLRGRRDLRELLNDPATPAPKPERLPAAYGEALRDLDGTNR